MVPSRQYNLGPWPNRNRRALHYMNGETSVITPSLYLSLDVIYLTKSWNQLLLSCIDFGSMVMGFLMFSLSSHVVILTKRKRKKNKGLSHSSIALHSFLRLDKFLPLIRISCKLLHWIERVLYGIHIECSNIGLFHTIVFKSRLLFKSRVFYDFFHIYIYISLFLWTIVFL